MSNVLHVLFFICYLQLQGKLYLSSILETAVLRLGEASACLWSAAGECQGQVQPRSEDHNGARIAPNWLENQMLSALLVATGVSHFIKTYTSYGGLPWQSSGQVRAPHVGAPGPIPGRETRSHMLQLRVGMRQ